MRIVCPYTRLHPDTDAALRRFAPDAERVCVAGSRDAYWQLVAGLWQAGEDFAIVEHDVVVGRGTVEALVACPHVWCVAAHNVTGFQAVRFRAELMAAHPRLLAELDPPRRRWELMALAVCHELWRLMRDDNHRRWALGEAPAWPRTCAHPHLPRVEHRETIEEQQTKWGHYKLVLADPIGAGDP